MIEFYLFVWLMKNLLFALISLGSVMALPVSASEKTEVYKELSELKKDYRSRISEIRKAGNEELKEESKKSFKAIAAVNKGIEEHPELADQRKARDEAKAAYEEARKGDDKDAEKAAARVYRDAEGALSRDGFKLKEIQDLQAASVAQRKKVEALQYKLVADSGPEGKALMDKIAELEARYEELKK